MKKTSFLFIIAFLLIFGVGLAYGYYYSQDNLAKQSIAEAEREGISIRNQLEDMRRSDIVAAQRGLRVLEQIQREEILWSEVLNLLLRIVPLDVAERRPLVNFISFSGSEGGRIAFNVQTNPSANVKRQLDAVATIIQTFNDSQVFYNAFVPSVSRSVTGEDQSVLSFILNVNYAGSVADDDLTNDLDPVPVN